MSVAFEVEEVIGRPVDEVWAALTDWSNAPRWMGGVDRMWADGDTMAGTRLTFVARGKERPSEIVRCDPGRAIVLRSAQGGVTADYSYELRREASDATRIALVADCQSEGLIWRMFFPLLRIAIARVDGSQLANLKRYVEGR